MKDKKLETKLDDVTQMIEDIQYNETGSQSQYGCIARHGGVEYEWIEISAPFVAGCIDRCHGALCLCCRGILDNKLVCKGGTGHKAAADRAVLSGSFRTLRVHVLLSAGHQ